MKVTLPIQRAPSRVCGDVLWAGTATLLAPCLCGLSYHLPASHKPCPDWIPSCSWDVPLAFISLCWFSGLNICCPLFFSPSKTHPHQLQSFAVSRWGWQAGLWLPWLTATVDHIRTVGFVYRHHAQSFKNKYVAWFPTHRGRWVPSGFCQDCCFCAVLI